MPLHLLTNCVLVLRELTPQMLIEFIEKIIVHDADYSSGEREQTTDIFLNLTKTITP